MALVAMVLAWAVGDGATVVEVVDAAGRPVAGARVAWEAPVIRASARGRFRWRDIRIPLGAELERALTAADRSTTTDAAGRAAIGDWHWVVASGVVDGVRQFAWAVEERCRDEGRPLQLTLAPERAVEVRLRDAEGAVVADHPIMLRLDSRGRRASEWSTRTDEFGIARFAPIDTISASVALWSDGAEQAWSVEVAGAFPQRIKRSFVLAELPEKPFKLRLPPTGRFIVTTVDSEGRPVATIGSVRAADSRCEPWSSETSAAEWVLPHVALGCELEVWAECDGHRDAEQELPGPIRAGETVAVRLVLDPFERLAATLRDAVGRPLADRECVLLQPNCDRHMAAEACSDAFGRIVFSPSVAVRDESTRLQDSPPPESWVEIVERAAGRTGGIRGALIRLPAPVDAPAATGGAVEPIELGEVTLVDSVCVAAGRVVDDLGVPLEGVEVCGKLEIPMSRLTYQQRDPLLLAHTCADGRFEWWATPREDRVAVLEYAERDLRSEHATHLLDSDWTLHRDGFAGAKEAQLILRRTGLVHGRIVGGTRATDGCDFSRAAGVDLELTARGGQPAASEHRVFLRPDGRFTTAVPHGSFTLTVRHDDPRDDVKDERVIAWFERVPIAPGEAVDVGTLALGWLDRLVELDIVDEDGRPIEAGWATALDLEQTMRATSRLGEFADRMNPPPRLDVAWFTGGWHEWRPQSVPPRLAVGAPGRCAVIVDPTEGRQRVVLAPAPQATLTVEWEGASLPAPFRLLADLGPTAADRDWLRFGPRRPRDDEARRLVPLDEIVLHRGIAVGLPLRCAGSHALELKIGWASSAGGFIASDRPFHLAELAVAPDPPGGPDARPQSFTVELDRDALDQAIARAVARR